nr:immunoglobulin light chain junction region [Macaca mulatta]MOW51711.1 immunoglobulin light chain junction region [Macaca mulatta]MOW52435.1 immunoglobulin light chain junction region [Macaca mulatta]MOW53329.1 immunoglobulin light chain junction region [Macaca mulatta]MOW53444.1 immunoglobulin light chain junction region [Macaca mulatta]
CMEALEFPYTF